MNKTLETTFPNDSLPRELGDGLTLRLARVEDTEEMGQFMGRVFGGERFDEQAVVWIRSVMAEAHPIIGPSNFTLVQDTRAGKIVSAMCLIPQTWTYAGIPFGVGRPEAVATDPAYRRRGLIRAQFEVHHAKSAALGHPVQAITGVPWYYRQFGYEYALDLGGGATLPLAAIPGLGEGETEPYRLRVMTAGDVPFVKPLYERDCARSLVACPRPDWLWRHMLEFDSTNPAEAREFRIIETAEGRAVGYLKLERDIWNDFLTVNESAVVEGQSSRAVAPSLLRALRPIAQFEEAAQHKPIGHVRFCLGREHPLYRAIPERLKMLLPYGWYMRVVDVLAFLRHVAPALEARLATSPLAGHSGEIKINEYTGGFRLVLEGGKLAAVEPWQRADPGKSDEDAAFPPMIFLQLLFGFRALASLRAAYPDCWAKDEADVLLDILFPLQPSHVAPV
ncbi:MAG: GNAT family N-acetyltransferase [Thermoflexales bacterium]|nr:GNAT family N-acetyltransferase [Thermoflexales bacterium]